MTEIIALLLLTGACCFGYDLYHSGKVTGSRKGYNVGRKHARRRK